MNQEDPNLPQDQIDGSSVTPSLSNELDYVYMFNFLEKRVDSNARQIDELRMKTSPYDLPSTN